MCAASHRLVITRLSDTTLAAIGRSSCPRATEAAPLRATLKQLSLSYPTLQSCQRIGRRFSVSDACSERLTAIDHRRPGGHLAGEVVQCPAAANSQYSRQDFRQYARQDLLANQSPWRPRRLVYRISASMQPSGCGQADLGLLDAARPARRCPCCGVPAPKGGMNRRGQFNISENGKRRP